MTEEPQSVEEMVPEKRGGAAPGNFNSMVHGAQSARIVGPRARSLVDEWMDPETGLQLTLPVDKAAILAVATAYARLTELAVYFQEPGPDGKPRGMIDSRGRPRGAAKLYLESFKAVMAGLAALGATPAARASMAGSIAALKGKADAEAAQARLRAKLGVAEEPE